MNFAFTEGSDVAGALYESGLSVDTLVLIDNLSSFQHSAFMFHLKVQDGKRKITIHFGVIGQGHDRTFSTLWFWHDNWGSFQQRFYTRKISIHFGTKGSRSQLNFVNTCWHNTLSSFQQWSFFISYIDAGLWEDVKR